MGEYGSVKTRILAYFMQRYLAIIFRYYLFIIKQKMAHEKHASAVSY